MGVQSGGNIMRKSSMPHEPQDLPAIGRRRFAFASLLSATLPIAAATLRGEIQAAEADRASPEIIDTNIHLFQWPFRRLKYGRTTALVTKLRKHRITKAWAGSFEAILEK